LGNPLKYTDPSGHCPICIPIGIGVGAAIAIYTTARVGWELIVNGFPSLERGARDTIGGALVVDASEAITAQSAANSVDPSLTAAVLRHESSAFERRLFTIAPGALPGALADTVELVQAYLQSGGTASIGPGQMQLRRAQELERLGYVRTRGSDEDRIRALLGRDTSVEYVAGMLHYVNDQLNTLPGFGGLSSESQQRLILLGYNWGWTQEFQDELARLGYEGFINAYGYDNQTLDEYLRWVQENSNR
jgi:hypothetical protein